MQSGNLHGNPGFSFRGASNLAAPADFKAHHFQVYVSLGIGVFRLIGCFTSKTKAWFDGSRTTDVVISRVSKRRTRASLFSCLSLRPETFAIADENFLATGDALCPLSTFASTEDEHADSLLHLAVSAVHMYVAKLGIGFG